MATTVRLVSAPLRVARAIALAVFCLRILTASVVSFAESYRGPLLWALQLDVFIATGELVGR